MIDLQKIKPEVERVCRRLPIKRLGLFGSALTRNFAPDSDVDVLVVFDPDENILYGYRIRASVTSFDVMASILYPFVRFKYSDGSVDPRAYTRLPIKVINPGNGLSVMTWGLLDTGADATLFPAPRKIRFQQEISRKSKNLR